MLILLVVTHIVIGEVSLPATHFYFENYTYLFKGVLYLFMIPIFIPIIRLPVSITPLSI